VFYLASYKVKNIDSAQVTQHESKLPASRGKIAKCSRGKIIPPEGGYIKKREATEIV
jgi:hypothetical protein